MSNTPVDGHSEEFDELAGLYALRVLDGDELARFEVHSASCERCQLMVRLDREALARPFVDNGEAFEPLAIGARVEHEVIRPHVILRGRRDRALELDLSPAPLTTQDRRAEDGTNREAAEDEAAAGIAQPLERAAAGFALRFREGHEPEVIGPGIPSRLTI